MAASAYSDFQSEAPTSNRDERPGNRNQNQTESNAERSLTSYGDSSRENVRSSVLGPNAIALGDSSSGLDIDGREEHILALLSVAYWRPIQPEALNFLRRASDAYQRGEKVLANVHLAHSRLPGLDNTDRAARRLFMADRLLAHGLLPLDLLKGLDIDATPLRLVKASPDDPKHPGWPAGTTGGLGGRFWPKLGDANVPSPTLPLPVVDFSGGFHDAVVDAWMTFFRERGIPAVKNAGDSDRRTK